MEGAGESSQMPSSHATSRLLPGNRPESVTYTSRIANSISLLLLARSAFASSFARFFMHKFGSER
jgi:hypothetical protein